MVRPYRHWNKRPYYGTIIGGVAVGTILQWHRHRISAGTGPIQQ